LSGCSNPYTQFYADYTGGINVLNLKGSNSTLSTSKPRFIKGSDVEQDGQNMLENGYILLGVSNFNAAEINQRKAIEQAKKIHADTVIVYYQYTNTLSGSMPITSPATQTTYHSGSIYGSSGGFASFSGNSTTYGTQTTYLPYHIRRYDYLATYWLKAKSPRLGIHFNDLTPELRGKIESNKGIYVIVVVKNSPAFNADLLTGDIIKKFNDVEIIDKNHFTKLLSEYKESNVQLEIFREGKTLIKDIILSDSSNGFQATIDTKTGKVITYPVYEDEQK